MLLTSSTGNKKDNVTIIYTPWSNLKKDGSMDVGQVSFKDNKKVKRVMVPQRENPIVNRLNKTKVERKPDLKQEKDDRDKEIRRKANAALQIKVRATPSSLSSVAMARNGGWDMGRMYADRCTEKRRSETSAGVEGKEVAKGTCVRRPLYRRQHGDAEQRQPRRKLGRRLYVARRSIICISI